ncbi:hypothetical protein AMTRI_Chr05g61710 [Amborella trichopoda]
MGGFQETCHGQGILTISLKKNSMMHIRDHSEWVQLQNKRVSREHQHTCKSTGLMRWESAHLMSSVISENPKIVAGMRILELGCGSGGICSMVAAKFADLVVATDGDSESLNLLHQNINSNLESSILDKLHCLKLEWGNADDINAVKELSPEGFDAIIGTDVNYVSDAILPLFETVGALISTRVWGRPPAFILCHVFCRVDGKHRSFLRHLVWGLDWWIIGLLLIVVIIAVMLGAGVVPLLHGSLKKVAAREMPT